MARNLLSGLARPPLVMPANLSQVPFPEVRPIGRPWTWMLGVDLEDRSVRALETD
jgi:hypothetical protein